LVLSLDVHAFIFLPFHVKNKLVSVGQCGNQVRQTILFLLLIVL